MNRNGSTNFAMLCMSSFLKLEMIMRTIQREVELIA